MKERKTMNQGYEDERGPQVFEGCLKQLAFLTLVTIVAVIFVLGLLAGVAIAAVL
jgi:hypothetical protein